MTQTPVKQQLNHLQQQIQHAMLKDQLRLQRQFNRLRSSLKSKTDEQATNQPALDKLTQAIEDSRQLYQLRQQKLPQLNYPEELPVSQKREQIIEAIQQHPVIVVCGETGSGKTTQLPKMCLQAGLGIRGMIGHTQPRRLAARSVASRIAEELNSEVGGSVGYKVRFTDTLSKFSHIKLMTDGILLSEIHHDPYLNQYDCIIVDEAHERSLNIDFLLGYLKQLSANRLDLKIIITSATIDPERFSRHFGNAPIIEVSGRTYPVDVEYRDTQREDGSSIELKQAIANCVDEISRRDRGDILVFLSGERDIREVADYLGKQHYQNTEILPLLARLSAAEQNRIFHTSSKRRIVLSTNVAETSLTVPGIKYVIDSGLARISRYSWRSKIQRLPIEKISQASANQRKGRCGRISAGVCYRLYSEDDFNLRDEFTAPEIQRTNLAAVILQMENMQLGHIDDFPFVEAPDERLVSDGYKLLYELGAIDKRQRITESGRLLSRLPLDPKLGRILIAAQQENCLHEALIIVSALAVQDPRERPVDKQQAADEAHSTFVDNRSDFISWLNIWNAYHQAKKTLSSNKLRKWCQGHFISWLRMREWLDTQRQIKQLLPELKFDLKHNEQSHEVNYAAVHRALLSGFLSQVGFKDEGHEYQSCRQRRFHIFPGSGLFNKGPKWVVASEIVETQKVYARHLAKIEPQWIEEIAAHLLKHSYTEAHWEKKSAQVSATRKSTLFGLLVNPGKKVNYGPINPVEAREIFIRNALTQGDFDCRHDFYLHNRKLVDDIENLEAKSRRQDILVDENAVYDFYDRHLPEQMYSGAQLNRWIKQNDSSVLFLSTEDLMQQDAAHVSVDLFPDSIRINSVQFPLEYHFDPSHHCDGITLITPASGLAALGPEYCDWLVPGLLQQKITELIRSLPKQLRKNFVPAPDFAAACAEALSPGDLPLTSALTAQLRKMTGVEIPYDAWQEKNLPDYLFFNIRVIAADGTQLRQSRDLASLQQSLTDFVDESPVSHQAHSLEQDNVDASALDQLPDHIEVNNHGIITKAFPALSVADKQVNIRIYYSADEAAAAHFAGLRQLFINVLSQPLRHIKSGMKNIQLLCAQYAPIGSCEQMKTQLIQRVIDQLFTHHLPRQQSEFQTLLDLHRSDVSPLMDQLLGQLADILAVYHALQKQLKRPPLAWLDAMADIQDQLNHLLHRDFILNTEQEHFDNLTRYLQAIEKRLQKIQDNPQRDRSARLEICHLWEEYKKRADMLCRNNRHSIQLEAYRWMLEEYRISLFAQEIKTRYPVSVKRLKKAWNEINDA